MSDDTEIIMTHNSCSVNTGWSEAVTERLGDGKSSRETQPRWRVQRLLEVGHAGGGRCREGPSPPVGSHPPPLGAH